MFSVSDFFHSGNDHDVKLHISRDGKVYHMEFERGKTVKKLDVIGKSKSTGTLITFQPVSIPAAAGSKDPPRILKAGEFLCRVETSSSDGGLTFARDLVP